MHVACSVGVVAQYFVNQSSGEGIITLLTAGFSSLYYILFLVASVAGLLYHGYFFVFHLLYIEQNNKDLKSAVAV